MPSTVSEIFAAADVAPEGVVRWGQPIIAPRAGGPSTGVYVIAVTDVWDSLPALAAAPISATAVEELLDARPECQLEGSCPSAEQITARLARFWLPDEVVLYIGCAGPRSKPSSKGELAYRIGEYYGTKLGARSPHAGGWFLKTLSNLGELRVHYGYGEKVITAEEAMLARFAAHVSPGSQAALFDPIHVMPFANLEYPKGVRKRHGIEKAKAP